MKPLGSTLVIRPGALGDAVLTLPALRALSENGARPLTVLGTPASWMFLNPGAAVIQVLDFSSSEWLGLFADGCALSERVRAKLANTELAIVYLADYQRLAERLKECGVSRVLESSPPVADDPRFPRLHAADRLLEPIDELMISRVKERGRAEKLQWLESTPAEEAAAKLMFAELTAKFGAKHFIALHPGSGGKRKCWGAKNFARLASRLYKECGVLPLILFGPADDKTRDEFQSAIPAGRAFHELMNRPLRELLPILRRCRGYIGNDSGVTHLAAQVTKTIAIFGPTDSAQWSPLGSHVQIIQAPTGALDKLQVESVFEIASAL